MKHKIFFIIASIALIFTACKEDEPAPIASVEISDAKIEASYKEADVHWRISSNATVSEVVLEYALDSAFTEFKQEKMSKLNPKTDDNLYTCVLKPLAVDTKYYVRCRAVNKINSHTSELQFFTTKGYNTPTVRTDSVSSITVSSALLHAMLLDCGTDTIPEVGFCFAKHANVTISDSCIICPITGYKDSIIYSVSLTNLEDNVKYFVRAYAKNYKGVAYGEELYFTTAEIFAPEIGLTTISDISYTTATVTSEVLSDGGTSVTERGICYYTLPNPTISDSIVSCGSGIGSFICSLTGLAGGTTYYFRAYAINSKGTSYGEEFTFTTSEYILPSVVTSAMTNISYTTATCLGEVTDDGGLSSTERGVCYSTSPNPIITDAKITSGSGVGSFTCYLIGLSHSTTYHIRAYATNSKGTSYGEELTFTTESSDTCTIRYTAYSKLLETSDSTSTSNGLHINAFNTSITSHDYNNGEGVIVFSTKLTSIGNFAFYGCSNLISLIIPKCVTYIGHCTFYNCTGLTSMIIPDNVTGIGEGTFQGCTSLTSVTIPNSVASIGHYAFRGCTSLTSVTIPNSVASIGHYALQGCTSLTSVTIPNSVTSIEDGMFEGCTSLTSVTIPNSVTSIGSSVFQECTSLISIEIPNSVKNLRYLVFYGCSGLTSISCNAATPPTCQSNTFSSVPKSIPVYVPASSVNLYKLADGWKEFTNILPISE